MTAHLLYEGFLCAVTAAGWGAAVHIILKDWRSRQ